MRSLLTLVLLSSFLSAQQLPDAPSATKQKCGGLPCYDYSAPKPSNWEVLKSPEFKYPTLAEWLAMGFDVGVTWRGLQEHKCVEGNPVFGPDPSLGKLVGYNLIWHGAVTGLRFGILKAIPKNEKSKARWIAKGFAIGSGVYASQLHIRAGAKWFTDGCM